MKTRKSLRVAEIVFLLLAAGGLLFWVGCVQEEDYCDSLGIKYVYSIDRSVRSIIDCATGEVGVVECFKETVGGLDIYGPCPGAVNAEVLSQLQAAANDSLTIWRNNSAIVR